MALELHVWGSALGLPSIDPDCLAAISYFDHVVPRADWTLIASNGAALNPGHILPALLHNGTWVSGYRDIVSYLADQTSYPVDDDFTPTQKADTLAYGSYLSQRAGALTAFSLYVSPTAWTEIVRPAYSQLLPFPLTWSIPPRIRAAAIAKTEHLGLDHLAADVDVEEDETDGLRTRVPTTSTGFLRLPMRPPMSQTLQPEQGAAAIRLDTITQNFFSVLADLKGDKKYLLGDEKPSSLDFLAYGYLSLLRVPTPHAFVEKAMRRSEAGRRLSGYLDNISKSHIGWKQDTIQEYLPWAAPNPQGFVGTTGRFIDSALESAPGGVGEAWGQWKRGPAGVDAESHAASRIILAAGGVLAVLAAVGSAVAFRALTPFGDSVHLFEAPTEKKTGLARFGEINAMLDSLPGFGAPVNHSVDTPIRQDGLEVDVDVESGGRADARGHVSAVEVDVRTGDVRNA